MRKGDDREKRGKNGKKIMMKIVATNVVASRPPERRPTATATALTNIVHVFFIPLCVIIMLVQKSPQSEVIEVFEVVI